MGELLRHCFHLGAPQLALHIFERIGKPSLFLQNLMIRSLCDDGLFQDVLGLYQRCQIFSCASDNFTFPFVIKACSVLGALQIGKEIHCVVLRTGFGDNLVVQTALVDFYAKNGQTAIARLVLDKIPQPDLVSWNALISGLCLYGLDQEVFEVFHEIRVSGLKPNVSTLASVIPLCSRLGNLQIGKSLHGFALKCGYFMDEFLTPALISMYAGGEDLCVARDMFDCLLKKNVTVWNAMISAYSKNQKPDDAFDLFKKMFQEGTQPNMVTFVSIIPSCEIYGRIWHGESIHVCVIKSGLGNQLSVVTSLLSMYAKLGYLNSAKYLFDRMPHRSLLSWNSMVSGYVYNGLWDASLAAFCQMQLAGFDPDAVSIVSILSSCSELHAILLGKSVHAFSIKNGIDLNLNVSNALMVFYSDCRKLSSSFNLFRRLTIRNSVSWNALISGCVHNGEAESAIVLLHQMQQEHMDLDLVTLISVLPCYNEAENLVQGMAIHTYAVKAGFDSDFSLANALISMFMNCGEFDAGMLIFQNIPRRNVVSWNALFTGCRYHNLQNEFFVLFGQMIEENVQPNHVTLLSILPLCCTHNQGKSIHAYAARSGIIVETPFLTSLILMYARFENTSSCLLLFQMGEQRNISLWNAIISALVQSREAKIAISLFRELLRMEMAPDYVTALSLTSACVQLNNLNLANSTMAYITHMGFDKDVAVCNALIDMYASCGDIPYARKIFEGLLQRDEISWSVMINGYALYGDGEAALNLFSQMRLLGLKLDDITYVSVLSACSHAGLVEEGRMIFNSMVENGIIPRMEHYACMVDLLGRTGHLDEAYDIIKSLPHKSFVNLLESLLASCLSHGCVELGEEIGRLLLEMDPQNSGPYVILYNLYAANERWADADRVRSNMERKQIIKVPGFSLVEGY